MNQELAEEASTYLLNRPLPAAKEEGEILVASADGKGVVTRRDPAGNAAAGASHQRKQGQPEANGDGGRGVQRGPLYARRNKSWRPCFAMHRKNPRTDRGPNTNRSGPACLRKMGASPEWRRCSPD